MINSSFGFQNKILLILLLMVSALMGGYAVAEGILDLKGIIILAAGLVTINLIIRNEHTQWLLLALGVASTVFGHRGVYIGRSTFLLPLEVIAWMLFVLVLSKMALAPYRPNIKIPKLLVFFLGWVILHGIVFLAQGEYWDNVLAWTSPLALALPIFVIVGVYINSFSRVELLLKVFLIVAIAMSFLALIEFFFPSLASRASWFFSSNPILTSQGFIRAAFGFWGYPAGAIVVGWGILIGHDSFYNSKSLRWSSVSLLAIGLGLVAVYISGLRASWIGLPLAFMVLSLSFRRYWIGGVIILFFTLINLPDDFWARVDPIIVFAQGGQVLDTSILSRLTRIDWAWEAIQSNPILGVGYGHFLVHNVFLEIASTIGVIASIIFLVFIIQLGIRLARLAYSGPTVRARQVGWLFVGLYVTWVVNMNVGTVFQIPPFAAPLWLLIAVGWNLPDIANKDNKPQVKQLG